MKRIIIAANGVKRQFPLRFSACADGSQLRELGEALIAASETRDGNYGWRTIDCTDVDNGPCNTEPLEWEESLPHKPSRL